MLCADDDDTRIHLMGGYLGTADILDHLVDSGVQPERVHTPTQYGLATAS